MSEGLKPCPFCLENKLLLIENRSRDETWEYTRAVVCMTCGACGPECKTDQEAKDAWNRRVTE